MYKNPQDSAQARRLVNELMKFGVQLSYARALEVTARLAGARTLHVKQARNNAGVGIYEVAQAQALALMFSTLGKFEQRPEELLAQLQALSAGVSIPDVFQGSDAPVIKPRYRMPVEALYPEYLELLQELIKVLQAKAQPTDSAASFDDILHTSSMWDWQLLDDGVEAVSEELRTEYSVKVQRTKGGSQFYVDILPPHQDIDELMGKPQMGLVIEVNQGVPCVHITNAVYGDLVVSIFSTEDGLYLRPETNRTVETGRPASSAKAVLAIACRDVGGSVKNLMSEIPFSSCGYIESTNRID